MIYKSKFLAFKNMTLFKKIINLKSLKNYISFFVMFFLLNNFIVLGSDDKSYLPKSKNKYDELEKIYELKSIPYSEYDGFYGQFKSFFGLNNDFSETSYYPDLSIISDSVNVREIYKSKLNDMIVDELIYKLKK